MVWNNDNGGPWGGNNSPWGSDKGSKKTPQQPDFDRIFRDGSKKLKNMFDGKGAKGIFFIILIAIALYAMTGFYRVQPNEVGVVLRFGEVVRTTTSGFHYHLPAPIEEVFKPNVTSVNLVEVGFRSSNEQLENAGKRDVLEESQMLTGDENIISMHFVVFWRIGNAIDYLFNVRNPEQTVKAVSESAVREVIGRMPFQRAYTESRAQVQTDAFKLIQKLLNQYKSGIEITQVKLQKADLPAPVVEAAIEVQRARTLRETLRNKAEAYQNDIIPRARGEAEKKIQQAEAYREGNINKAKGDADRFTQLYDAYKNNKSVTRDRLYLEMAEQVLQANKIIYSDGKQNIIIADSGAKAKNILPLPNVLSDTHDQSAANKIEQVQPGPVKETQIQPVAKNDTLGQVSPYQGE